TTNAIEALNRQLRKAIKTKGHFPKRRSRAEADLPRDQQRDTRLDEDPQLDGSTARVQDPLRRPTARLNPLTQKIGRPPLGRGGRRCSGSRLVLNHVGQSLCP